MRDVVIDRIFATFRSRGDAEYLGEAVSQSEHALQAACAAERAGAPDALVAAALLHDYGHLIHDLDPDCADHGVDSAHEDVGSAFLEEHFGPAVTEPLRLHVAAKRYLCAVDPAYLDRLSAASRHSLELQGGPYGADDVRAFECEPYWRLAVELRRFDDVAKESGLATPDFEHYRPVLRRVCAAS